MSRVALKSATIASHSACVIFSCWCDSFIARPVYLHGPPLASQTSGRIPVVFELYQDSGSARTVSVVGFTVVKIA